MSATRWGGHASRTARAALAPRLPLPCCRCGRPVIPRPWLPADGWHPDHFPIPRHLGGTEMWPAHAECNLRDGGQRGAAITNARRASRPRPAPGRPDPRAMNMRGI